MSSGLYSIGVTGMNAAQLGLLTTEHNIANSMTAGYNRQRTIQATNIPIMTGAGSMGQGTHVATVERMYSKFLSGQVNRAQTGVSELDAYYSEIAQIDNMLADPSSGLSPALQEFFSAAQQVAANPASMSARQSMISMAESMVSRYQGLQSRLNELADGINGQVTDVVQNINSYAREIAELNNRIVVAESSVQQPSNDLRDQRDELVSELNKLVRVQVNEDSNGSYNVFIGSGQTLVVGPQTQEMTATAAIADISTIVIGLKTATGNVQELPEGLVDGGQLGGLLRFRSEALNPAFNQLGRIAASMALTFNAQHALGQDLLGQASGEGNFQGDFFTIPSPVVLGNAINTGTADISANFVEPDYSTNFYTNLSASDYRLSYDGTNYTLKRLDDNNSWSAASIATLSDLVDDSEGFTLAGTGTMDVGDTFIIRPTKQIADSIGVNVNIANDPRLVAAAMPVRDSSGVANTGNAKISNTRTIAGYSPAVATLPFTLTYGAPAQFDGYNRQSGISNYDFSGAGLAQFDVDGIGVTLTTNLVDDAGLSADLQSQLPGYTVTVNAPGDISISRNGSLAPVTITNADVNAMAAGFVNSAGTAGTPAAAGTLTISPAAAAAQNFSVTIGGTTTVYSGGIFPYDPATGAKVTVNGIAFDLNGTPNFGDTFTIERNTGGNADGRNMLALGKLQTQKTVAGGSASYQDAYAQLVSDNGNRTRQIEVTGKAQQALLQQASNSREAMSGVNLDEEAANLIRFQQAYQASAKMLQIGSKLFETLLALG
ncbi:MAG: hypothetical protein H6R18_788 [Proteobacteria bacterium]|nr:hypothetical protein [Pseudomonadota bacterium]